MDEMSIGTDFDLQVDDDGSSEQRFRLTFEGLHGVEVIVGTAELRWEQSKEGYRQEGYIKLTQRPRFMTDQKARQLVLDAVCKGRSLGLPYSFARKLRAACES